MRIRHALTSLTLGSALVLAGTTVTAQAAEPARSSTVATPTAVAAPSWHYHSTYYNSPTPCIAAGEAQDLPYKCEMGLPGALLPFYLYLWY
ncbi:hypothetical protein [Streptomyces sp. NPDC006285]|uniref:hypothetical protein n=1 Tax=Streptomyces sp. NPDC006285 TaxID=3364742 RepID=UPI0036AD7BD2